MHKEISVEFTPQLIILNNYAGQHKYVVNMCIIILKQYIYAAKCLEEKITFATYITKLSHWYYVDKEIANQRDCYKKFEKNWKNMF